MSIAQVSTTESRRNFAAYFDRVSGGGEVVRIVRRGREPAMLMPLREYERLRVALQAPSGAGTDQV